MKTSIVAVTGIVCQLILMTCGTTKGNPIVQIISPLLKLESSPNTCTLTCTHNTLKSVNCSKANVTLMWFGIIQGILVRIQPRDVAIHYHRNNSHFQEQTLNMNELYDTYSMKHDTYIWCQAYYITDNSGVQLSSVYTIPNGKGLKSCRNTGVKSRGVKNKILTSGQHHYRRGIVRRQADNTTNSNQQGECSQGIIALLVVASGSFVGAAIACSLTTGLLLANLRRQVTVFRRQNNYMPRLNTNSQLPLEIINTERESLPTHSDSMALAPIPEHAYDTVSNTGSRQSSRDSSSYMDMTNGQDHDKSGEDAYL